MVLEGLKLKNVFIGEITTTPERKEAGNMTPRRASLNDHHLVMTANYKIKH
jgi:hypothetical protein